MRQSANPSSAARGFTLVEVLVGLVLGMLCIIIMYQVLATFERQRRTTVGGTDAQSSGHVSMFMIERDVRLAGLGMNYIRPTAYDPESVPLCAGGIRTYTAAAGGLGWATQGPVVPVLVTNGTAASTAPFSDTFVVSYLPTAVAVTPRKVNIDLSSGTLGGGIRVSNAPWLNPGTGTNAMFFKDQHILVGQRPLGTAGPFKHCVRLKISDVVMEAPGNPKSDARLMVAAGTGYDINPPSSEYANFLPAGGYKEGESYVMPSGGAPATKRYEVNAQNQLLLAGTPIAEGVISLQVQYGIGRATSTGPSRAGMACSGNGSQQDGSVDPSCSVVVGWTDAVAGGPLGDFSQAALSTTPPTSDPVNATGTLDRIRRIKVVRIAVVARSANLEKCKLYSADLNCPLDGVPIAPKNSCTAAGDIVDVGGIRICAWRDPAGGTAVPLVNPSVTPDEATCAASLGASCWDRYRYKVYETVIPLRNVIWGTRTI